ncbi:MAG: hypothetical protein KAJ14_09230 [Candidatus Omnitrophica bacterium]|nr:hypothetical protein [Candidatus Omnitrophota bacterium]
MKRIFVSIIGIILLGTLLGCETAMGVTRDVANTARNIRNILSVGKDIDNMSK